MVWNVDPRNIEQQRGFMRFIELLKHFRLVHIYIFWFVQNIRVSLKIGFPVDSLDAV